MVTFQPSSYGSHIIGQQFWDFLPNVAFNMFKLKSPIVLSVLSNPAIPHSGIIVIPPAKRP